MNLTYWDWAIVVLSVIAIRLVSLRTRKYCRGVADFLSANRSAGRYLLTIANHMGGVGVITFIAMFEVYYTAGFPPLWWGLAGIPINCLIILSGWVYYRFRETRALTMAQFLEMRYSRKFRVFAGVLCWISGLVNFGIFPAVAAHFFVYFCGLPQQIHLGAAPFAIPTFAVVMAVDLVLALTFVNMGGQVSVMVTECVQGIFSGLVFLAVCVVLLVNFNWSDVISGLSTAGAGKSMIDPFHIGSQKDFDYWYFIIGQFLIVYAYMSWQGTQGFYSSARTPHEQRMGNILGGWRVLGQNVLIIMMPVVAYAIMHLTQYTDLAEKVNASLAQIGNEAVRRQMLVPIAMAHLFPAGIKGLFVTTMLFFSFTCHDTYMHSWGSIFIQDVVMPIRRRVLTPEQHIMWLRRSIACVAAFGFLFSLFYTPSDYITFFFLITGTIWQGGAGAVIIGGLYWRRGSTAAAYAAMVVGAVVGVGGMIVQKAVPGFPFNGQQIMFSGTITASLVYIVTSLLTTRGRTFNLTKMLHRGPYAVEAREPVHAVKAWHRLVGITAEFSAGDRVLTYILLLQNLGWTLLLVVVSIAAVVLPNVFVDEWWAQYWKFYVWLNFVLAVPATIWFSIGGVQDIRMLFHTLATAARDHSDDGRVPSDAPVDHRTAGESPIEPETSVKTSGRVDFEPTSPD